MKMLPRRLQFTPMAFRLAHWCHNNLLISYLPEGGEFGFHQSSVQSLLFEQLMIPNLLTQRAPMFIIWFNNLPVTIAARIHPLASWGGLRLFNLHRSVKCRIFLFAIFPSEKKKTNEKNKRKQKHKEFFSVMGANRWDCLELNTKPEIILSDWKPLWFRQSTLNGQSRFQWQQPTSLRDI